MSTNMNDFITRAQYSDSKPSDWIYLVNFRDKVIGMHKKG